MEIRIECQGAANLPLESLEPIQGDLKQISNENYAKLKNEILTNGFSFPFFVWQHEGKNWILDGHHRRKVLIKMMEEGYKIPDLPCATVNARNMKEAAEKLLAVTSQYAKITKDGLKDFIDKYEIDFDSVQERFEFSDVDFRDLEIEVISAGGNEDYVPTIAPDPITKRGDVWILGDHRLMCGDSTMIDDVEKLMDGNKADMLFTDPPYNVAFNGRSGKHQVIKNDNLSEDDFEKFMTEVCQVIEILNPKDYYVWCNWKFYGLLQNLLKFKSCIVWAKNNFGMGISYRHQHEFCLFNGAIDSHIKNESDLWHISKDTKYQHPTQKPVALSVRAIANHVKSINIVDLFGGSGSTLIGCEQTRRKCFTMELDEKYCDVIIKRWQEFTKNDAVLEATGDTFNQLL